MRMSFMPIALLKRSLSAAVLAGMFSVFVLHATDPAAARVILLSQCQKKHAACSERCIMNNYGNQIEACIKRTCDKQHPGCGGASIGKSGGGKLQTNPGGSTGGGIFTSPSGGVGSWTNSGSVFAPKLDGAVLKKKPHAQPKQTPTAEPEPGSTAEPKPAPTTPGGPSTTSTPVKPRDHRVTRKVGDDRSSAGVTTTHHTYEGAVKASGTGPSEKRKPKIIDHRGVDPASRDGADKRREPKIVDHRNSSTQPSGGSATGSNCGTQGNPGCLAQ